MLTPCCMIADFSFGKVEERTEEQDKFHYYKNLK